MSDRSAFNQDQPSVHYNGIKNSNWFSASGDWPPPASRVSQQPSYQASQQPPFQASQPQFVRVLQPASTLADSQPPLPSQYPSATTTTNPTGPQHQFPSSGPSFAPSGSRALIDPTLLPLPVDDEDEDTYQSDPATTARSRGLKPALKVGGARQKGKKLMRHPPSSSAAGPKVPPTSTKRMLARSSI
ncbi:hypothetical protein C8R46DRAFT_1038692 [Mycena filopes]|nr:hypothetical protein C8R46DRAFT_1038692 [Mycena filopes]